MLIVDPGHTWVTDLGRFAGPSRGLSVNGALDQCSAQTANILVGNASDTPLLDVLHTGLSFIAEHDLLLAVTGADCVVQVDGRQVPMWLPISALAGQTVEIGASLRGLRKYVAVRGGFDVPMLLGSCAPDSMIGFGTRLTAGQRLAGPIPTPALQHPVFQLPLMRLTIDRPKFPASALIDVTDGPDYAEFGDSAELLFRGDYEVSPRSNHVGLRLSGELPRRQRNDEVLSRGVPVGAIEVPSPDGLLVLHRGRGVTAGYPVLAVVTAVGLDAIAQIQPGQHLRFRRVSLEEAHDRHLQRHARLQELQRICRNLLTIHGVAPATGPAPTHRLAA